MIDLNAAKAQVVTNKVISNIKSTGNTWVELITHLMKSIFLLNEQKDQQINALKKTLAERDESINILVDDIKKKTDTILTLEEKFVLKEVEPQIDSQTNGREVDPNREIEPQKVQLETDAQESDPNSRRLSYLQVHMPLQIRGKVSQRKNLKLSCWNLIFRFCIIYYRVQKGKLYT